MRRAPSQFIPDSVAGVRLCGRSSTVRQVTRLSPPALREQSPRASRRQACKVTIRGSGNGAPAQSRGHAAGTTGCCAVLKSLQCCLRVSGAIAARSFSEERSALRECSSSRPSGRPNALSAEERKGGELWKNIRTSRKGDGRRQKGGSMTQTSPSTRFCPLFHRCWEPCRDQFVS
jgi:hypothetical protein